MLMKSLAAIAAAHRTFIKWFVRGIVFLYFVFGLLFVGARWYLTTHADDFRETVTEYASRASGLSITADAFRFDFDWIWPRLFVENVQLAAPGQAPALTIKRATVSLSWSSLWYFEPRLRSLEVIEPTLTIRRVDASHLDILGRLVDISPDALKADKDEVKAAERETKNPGERNAISWQRYAVNLLFAQEELNVHNGLVRYVDEIVRRGPVSIDRINARFSNQILSWKTGLDAHIVTGSRTSGVTLRAHLYKGLFTDPSNPETWTLDTYAKLDNTSLTRLATRLGLRSYVRSGEGDVTAWLTLKDGHTPKISVDADLKNANFRLAPTLPFLSVDAFKGRVAYTETADREELSRKLAAQNLTLSSKRDGWRFGPANISFAQTLSPERKPRTFDIRADRIDLGTLSRIAASLPIPERARQFFLQTPVRGTLAGIDLHAQGEPSVPENWYGSLSARHLSLKSGAEGSPGFSSISADLSGEKGSPNFTVRVKSPGATLTFPTLFRRPTMRFDELSAQATLKVSPEPVLDIQSLKAQNKEAAVTAQGTLNFANLRANLAGKIERANATAVVHYLPHSVGEHTLDWLEAGILGGRVTQGDWVLKGDLHHFPWDGNKNGHFRIRGHAEDVTLDLMPSHTLDVRGHWRTGEHYPPLEKISADLLFEGHRMLVTARSAESAGLSITNARVEIPSFIKHPTPLIASGEIRGDLRDAIAFLNDTPDMVHHLGTPFKESVGSGPFSMKMALTLPLSEPQNFEMKLDTKLEGASLKFNDELPEATELKGAFTIAREGVTTKTPVLGRTSAGPLSISVNSDKDHVNIKADTVARAQDLEKFLAAGAKPFTSRLSGATNVSLDVDVPLTDGPLTVKGSSTLAGITSTLPVPFAKPGPEPWPLNYTWTAYGNDRALRLTSPGHADLNIRFNPDDIERTISGTIALGNARAPASPGFKGLALALDAPSINVDDWRALIAPEVAPTSASVKAEKDGKHAKDGDDFTPIPEVLAESPVTMMAARVGTLLMGERSIHELDATLRRFEGRNWHLRIASDIASGQAEWLHPVGEPPTLTLKMTRLFWPDTEASVSAAPTRTAQGVAMMSEAPTPGTSANAASSLAAFKIRPYDLPNLNVVVDDLRYHKRKFGKLEASGRNGLTSAGEGYYDIRKFALTSDAGKLTGHGLWQPSKKGDAVGFTSVKLDADFKDSGRVLDDLDLKNVLRNAPAKLSAQLVWRGMPYAPDIATLTGHFEGNMGSGQILQVEPGAGRLLSLLSMQHLLKRLRLDFSDVVSKGFGFDSIAANVTVKNGVASSDHFAVVGSSATIVITGQTDFANEQLNLDALILPKISAEGPALALTLANPAVGLGTFIAQWLLKDEISKWLRTRYRITGNFDEPLIEKYNETPEKSGTRTPAAASDVTTPAQRASRP